MAMCKYRFAEYYEIPEWDKEKYPFALLQCHWDAQLAKLAYRYMYLLSEKPILKDGKWAVAAGSELCVYNGYSSKGDWDLRYTGSAEGWGTDFYDVIIDIIWTNFDLLDEKGNVYSIGSDPIPVYE